MTQFKCTIHNVTFEASNIDKKLFPDAEDAYVDCPHCSWNERKKLREENKELKGHRDALLRAFEIKATVTKYASSTERTVHPCVPGISSSSEDWNFHTDLGGTTTGEVRARVLGMDAKALEEWFTACDPRNIVIAAAKVTLHGAVPISFTVPLYPEGFVSFLIRNIEQYNGTDASTG